MDHGCGVGRGFVAFDPWKPDSSATDGESERFQRKMRKNMDDHNEEEVFLLGDVADLTLGEGSSDNEDKRKIYN